MSRNSAVKFVARRLTQLREARGFTRTAVGRMTRRTPQAISSIEREELIPGADTVEELTKALNVPYGFFFEPMTPAPSGTMFYRSMSSATKLSRLACEAHYHWLDEIVGYLCQFVKLPAYDVPDLGLPVAVEMISPETIESAASACRRAWGLGDGPISNVAWLLENHGCVVSRFPFESESQDAFSNWNESKGRGFILLNADKRAAARSRFDACHELFHLIAHRHLSPADYINKAKHKLIESQAHRFAGAFLLPAKSFSADLAGSRTMDDFVRLKDKWRCAISMMFRRARDLGIFDEEMYLRRMIGLGRRGWRMHEPLDEVIEPEQPQLLRGCFHLLAVRGVQTVATMRDALKIPHEDVSMLVGLEPGFLTEPPPTGEIIEMHPTFDSVQQPMRERGRVVHFGQYRSKDTDDLA